MSSKSPILGSISVIHIYISAYLRELLTASFIKDCEFYFKKLLQSGIFHGYKLVRITVSCVDSYCCLTTHPPNIVVYNHNSRLFCSQICNLSSTWQRQLICAPRGVSLGSLSVPRRSTFRMVHSHGWLQASP